MMGFNMLMESMGVDPTQLQNNVNAAVQHVKQIDERMARLEQATVIILNHTTKTSEICLRIEDAVNQLRTDSPPHSTEFVHLVNESYPDAADQIQNQIEGVANGRGNQPNPEPTQPTNENNSKSN